MLLTKTDISCSKAMTLGSLHNCGLQKKTMSAVHPQSERDGALERHIKKRIALDQGHVLPAHLYHDCTFVESDVKSFVVVFARFFNCTLSVSRS